VDSVELPADLAHQIADINTASASSSIPDLKLGSDLAKLRQINNDIIAMRSEIDLAGKDFQNYSSYSAY
jgi:hypothetical protein